MLDITNALRPRRRKQRWIAVVDGETFGPVMADSYPDAHQRIAHILDVAELPYRNLAILHDEPGY